jgi:ABC-type Co2+ transport system permease subunit
MLHIHLPLVFFQNRLFWWLLTIAPPLVALVVTRRRTIAIQRLAIAGMLAALSFAVFQINIPSHQGVHRTSRR